MPLPYCQLPAQPGFALPRTYAPSPVWAGSTSAPARFVAIPGKAAIKLWHRAREFDRQSHEPGQHGGAVGRTALAVLHALVADPGHEAWPGDCGKETRMHRTRESKADAITATAAEDRPRH